jgi:hypothetical protein
VTRFAGPRIQLEANLLRFSMRLCSLAVPMFVLVLPGAGCYTTRHQALGPATSLDSASGVTMRSGAEIQFARPGAKIAHDTMFATGTVGDLRIPTDSISQVNSRGYSSGSSLVVIGAFAAAVAALLYISVAYSTGGS